METQKQFHNQWQSIVQQINYVSESTTNHFSECEDVECVECEVLQSLVVVLLEFLYMSLHWKWCNRNISFYK